MCACVRVCMCVCICVLDCVLGNSENVQTVYKVCKSYHCAHVFQNIFDSIHVRFKQLLGTLNLLWLATLHSNQFVWPPFLSK